ncbi:hypothetical protein NEOLEDRAFT_768296 [Neolentinus lepideus HHB14362 ss-1]|uniref:Cupredoxin n=1 Tax=Neolentinus lepideus HHB14362 ss-1 TaxID=1314782 RepID=A0A165UTA0_9AGAM|nr:hypothetical protein NEOLEDRAFT_768296 [Neolentinus lepideus HHB14362 ss-1]
MLNRIITSFAALSFATLPAVFAAEHAVTVGGVGILQFNPESLTADPGDVITFTFKQKNHTVSQSTLSNPCQLAENGFDSGFVPVADNNTAGPFPTAQFTVQDSNPVWVFCRQANHCQQGMVFAVNPGNNFDAFKAAATGNTTSANATSTSATATAPVSTTIAAAPISASGPVTVTATVTVSGGQQVTTTYGSYPGSSAPTSAVSTDHKIVVGGPGLLTFSPSNISAQMGDTITFEFQEKNHTATQSSFADPCRSLTETSTSGQVGFDSGFMPVSTTTTNFPTFTIQVNDTSPIWVYCKQTGHCGQGMVFSANAVESGSNNFAAFQSKAKQLNGTSSATSSSSTSAGERRADAHRDVGVAMVVITLAAGMML